MLGRCITPVRVLAVQSAFSAPM